MDRVLVLWGWVSRLDCEEGRDRNPSNTPNPPFSTPPKTPMRFLQAVKPRRRGRNTVWTAFSYFGGGCPGLIVRRGGIATLQTLLSTFSTPPKTPMRFLQAVKPRRRGRNTVWTAFSYFGGGCPCLIVRRGRIATLQTLLIHLFRPRQKHL